MPKLPTFLHRLGLGRREPSFTLVFLHIPKTAGISLRELLLARYQPVFRILHPIDDRERLMRLAPEERERLALVEGHLYYGVHELLPRPCRYLTMLRDPLERVLSYYSYIREWTPHHLHAKATRMTLEQCVREGLTVELDNFMVRCLTSLRNVHVPFGGVTRGMLDDAREHLSGFAAVGLTERFEESATRFARVLGWKDVVFPRLNVTANRARAADVPEADLHAVREQNRLDQELYDFARELFDRAGPS